MAFLSTVFGGEVAAKRTEGSGFMSRDPSVAV
jgi:hypothetical protein